jgi:hypothetical protein
LLNLPTPAAEVAIGAGESWVSVTADAEDAKEGARGTVCGTCVACAIGAINGRLGEAVPPNTVDAPGAGLVQGLDVELLLLIRLALLAWRWAVLRNLSRI